MRTVAKPTKDMLDLKGYIIIGYCSQHVELQDLQTREKLKVPLELSDLIRELMSLREKHSAERAKEEIRIALGIH